ncbi:MAG: hypothetical protein IJE43_23820 [Alphaproteobacteria bacterium]|nr:hypothetical protein [Alphaproteobacteria bacterium]
MNERKVVVDSKVKVQMFLRKLYEEGYLSNDEYVIALKLAKEVKNNECLLEIHK